MKNLEKFMKKKGQDPSSVKQSKDSNPGGSVESSPGLASAMGESENEDVDELLKRLGLSDGKKITISVSGGEPKSSD